MKVQIYGSRGSIPIPGDEYSEYGGNTSCIQVSSLDDPNEFIILDAGTGLRRLGKSLSGRWSSSDTIILLTHFHWDHIFGIPFFLPFYDKSKSFTVYGPKKNKQDMYNVLNKILSEDYFPVNFNSFASHTDFGTFYENKQIKYKNFKIDSIWVNHPCPTLAYRVKIGGKKLVYLTDHEPYSKIIHHLDAFLEKYKNKPKKLQDRILDFISGADLLISDAEYTKNEYVNRLGWGHSTMEDAIDLATEGGVSSLLLFHHNQERKDSAINSLHPKIIDIAKNKNANLDISFAKERSLIIL